MVELKNGSYIDDQSCPVCGVMSRAYSDSTTLVNYSSPRGHDHDNNCRKFLFRCKAGHGFSIRVRNLCPTVGCDWKGKEDCFCHPGLLVVPSADVRRVERIMRKILK